MPLQWKPGLARAFAACVVLLSACGGGGGGGDGSTTPPPTGSGGTGLVPAAPAPGTVLLVDSARLRPIEVGLSWHYRQFTPFAGLMHTRVAMAAGSDGRVIERSNDPGVDDSELWRDASGQTLGSITVPISGGRSLVISGVELPRELRTGQQFTVYDARSEGVDIAIWRTVIGFEDLSLPASPNPVRALRVDDRVALRASASSASSTVSQVHGSTWYATDIGIVRSVVWVDATQTATSSDERLVGFDGQSRGFGTTTSPAVSTFGQTVVLDDGYVTLDGVQTRVADRHGRLRASGSIVRAPEEPYDARLLPTAAGMRVATLARFSAGTTFNLDALNEDGQLQGERLGGLPIESSDPFILATSSSVALSSHQTSPVIWMVFIESLGRTDGSGLTDDFLVLQRFDTNGLALGDRQALRLTETARSGLQQIQVLPDGLLLLLRQGGVHSPERFRALELDNDGATRADRTYQLSDRGGVAVRLVIDGAARWLAWRPDDGLPRAWRLAEDGTPLGVTESLESAQAAIVPLPEGVRDQWPFSLVSAGGQWTIPGSEFGPLTGHESIPATRHGVLALFDPGAGDVSTQAPARVLRLSTAPVTAQGSVRFSDRTLWRVLPPVEDPAEIVIQWR